MLFVLIFFNLAYLSLFVDYLCYFTLYRDFSVHVMIYGPVLAPFIDPFTVSTCRPWSASSASSASAGVTSSPAMTSSEGMARFAVLLLENGANFDAQDSTGR